MNKLGAPTLWTASAVIGTLMAGILFVLYRFDPVTHSFYPVCLLHQTTGLLCPGCGSLRALHQLLHGNIVQAFRFNPLLMVALPVLIWWGVFSMVKRRHEPLPLSSVWLWLLLGVALGFTIWRNLPGRPFAALPG